jgi:8-oxo-dGTP diphosphatase
VSQPAEVPEPVRVVPVVSAAIVDDLRRPTRILAARRTEPPHLAGRWELPGGKVEAGEAPLAALHRELQEELGVSVQVGPEIPGPGDAPGWQLSPTHRMRVWLVEVAAGEPAPLEDHDAVRWLGPGEWFDVDWLSADLPVVEAVSRLGRRR